MMILSKIWDYLFSLVPNNPSIAWFKSPEISLNTLQTIKDSGGLKLPNFYHYFLANRLHCVEMDQIKFSKLPMAGFRTSTLWKSKTFRSAVYQQ